MDLPIIFPKRSCIWKWCLFVDIKLNSFIKQEIMKNMHQIFVEVTGRYFSVDVDWWHFTTLYDDTSRRHIVDKTTFSVALLLLQANRLQGRSLLEKVENLFKNILKNGQSIRWRRFEAPYWATFGPVTSATDCKPSIDTVKLFWP